MIYFTEPYLNKQDFIKRIDNAVNDLLYRALGAEKLGEVLYDDLFQICIWQVQENIRKIKNDLECGDTFQRQYSLERELRDEINFLKTKVNSLETLLHDSKSRIDLISKNS